ncbi:MAG: AAA family ATPase [Actinomycetia bacterium]|nr:AAA family ATPase [Actinomycetes bacterium]
MVATDIAFDRIVEALESDGRNIKREGRERVRAQCPAHESKTASSKPLAVTGIDGQTLIYCHAGCDTQDVLASLDLTMADLFDTRSGASYEYPDDRWVHRSATKTFKQSGNTKGRSLFHADKIGDAATVYVAEGEKDVLSIESVGGVAVCSAMGAGKAHLANWTPLNGKTVIVVADKDGPGRKHATQVADAVTAAGADSIAVVEAKTGKDAADHIAAGHSLEDFHGVDWWPLEAPQANEHPEPRTSPRLWRASELKPAAQPKWLAKNRIPQAAVTILIGEEGIGKSLLWVLIAAAVTTGKPMPEFGIPQRDAADVLLILTEDEWSTAVLPRLEVAGADTDRVRVICTDEDGSGSPTFPDDMATILDADPPAAMVVCDAWLDTVPGNLRAGDPQQSRQALHPWKEAASATGASMTLLTHANRLGTANIRDKYGISASLRQKARMTLYCLPGDDGGFIVGPDKSNGASARTRASTFRIKSIQHFEPTNDHDGTVPLLEFVGESDKTIKEHLAEIVEAERSKGKPPSAAELWLRGQLEGGERKLATAIYNTGKALGFSVDQIKRAKGNINKGSAVHIVVTKDAVDERWYWAMIQQTGEGE